MNTPKTILNLTPLAVIGGVLLIIGLLADIGWLVVLAWVTLAPVLLVVAGLAGFALFFSALFVMKGVVTVLDR